MRKKLYQIYRVIHNVNKPVPKYSSIKILEENGNWAYPLVEVGISNNWDRSDYISMDTNKLLENIEYLNEMSDDGESYEIREVEYPDYLF